MAEEITKASVFDIVADIEKIIQEFDFSSIDVKDETKKDYLHQDLAPSYRNLTDDDITAMDDKLKVMTTAVCKAIKRIPSIDRTWEVVVNVLQQNMLIEPMDEISNTDDFKTDEEHYFKFDGSPDPKVVEKVHSWFVKLVDDQDILDSTQIDLDIMGRIVAQTGATITNFMTFWYKHERHEKAMIDIGVLRYPDTIHPYFKLFRIKLVAWSDSSRIVFAQHDMNGITGEIYVRRYKPRNSVIDGLKDETVHKAVQVAENFLKSPLVPDIKKDNAVQEAEEFLNS